MNKLSIVASVTEEVLEALDELRNDSIMNDVGTYSNSTFMEVMDILGYATNGVIKQFMDDDAYRKVLSEDRHTEYIPGIHEPKDRDEIIQLIASFLKPGDPLLLIMLLIAEKHHPQARIAFRLWKRKNTLKGRRPISYWKLVNVIDRVVNIVVN